MYDAVQVSLNRRFSNNWFLAGNYTMSRLYGNYAGIASSDEIRTPGNSSFAVDQQQGAGTARPGGSANRAFDLDEMMWDANGNLDVTGRLATDRPHVFKVYGAYMTPFGTQIGLNQYVGSGTPLTTEVRTLHTLVYPEGRGDMGRTPTLALTDLLLSHELRMRGSDRIRFELNVINLFNQKTVRHRFVGLNRNRGAGRGGSPSDQSGQRLRLSCGDQRVAQRSGKRLRSALQHAGPLERRYSGSLHGEVPVLRFDSIE